MALSAHSAALAGLLHPVDFLKQAVPEALKLQSETGIDDLVELASLLSIGELPDKGNPPRQMVTIFDRLHKDVKAARAENFLPLKPLQLDKGSLFPASPANEVDQKQAAQDLQQRLREEASRPNGSLTAYLESLAGALLRYAWSLPSGSYQGAADVSLYEHAHLTAALAACLADQEPGEIKDLLEAVRESYKGKPSPVQQALLEKPVALLIGGDISGIQKFIYSITSKGAAKTLRGRSFYLQLLSEAVLRYVLRELGLPYTNVIYAGGGHFFLLAPLHAAHRLDHIREQVTSRLIHHHGISLYLAIGSAEVPAKGFARGRMPLYWSKMHAELRRAKQRRYLELGPEFHRRVLAVSRYGGNPDDTCSVCGEDRRHVAPLGDGEDPQARICDLCSSFDTEIGGSLPDARFVALGLGNHQDELGKPAEASQVLADFGLRFQLLRSAQEAVKLPGAEQIVVWALDDLQENAWPRSTDIPTTNLLHYTVKQRPEGTFEDLLEQVNSGFKRLGVLRMDVDDLGDLFSRGFGNLDDPKSSATLARLSTLSFQVSLFFEGWIKRLVEEYPRKVYGVYAGGDDLFLLGPWDIIPDLAKRICEDFAQYTGYHPALHLSGGMTFIGGKYPVYQAATDAGKAVDKAKAAEGKNSFTFLEEPWSWADFTALTQKKDKLVRLVKKVQPIENNAGEEVRGKGGPQSILQTLRQMAALEAEAVRQRGRPVWGRWMWLSAYQFHRLAELYKRQPELAEEIKAIHAELSEDNYRKIQHWGAAARWAQLLTRKKSEK